MKLGPTTALLLASKKPDEPDGVHFVWFRDRLDRSLYTDLVVAGLSAK
jgi:predicted GNAT superfamily acetyltransferase